MTVNLNDFTVYSKSDGKMGGDIKIICIFVFINDERFD
jgi:hypothetical protein